MPITAPDTAPKPKQERWQRRMYLDTRIDPSTGTPELYLIGEDNDDLTRAISWNTNTVKNVVGHTSTSSTKSEETVSADPFYAREGDAMAALLQHFDETNAELDSIKRNYYEAKIDNTGATIYAFRQIADIKLQSVGGPADDADSLPFEISLSGAKIEQNYSFATEKFTDVTP